jgi:[ribosomal protein S18]-alanine N-acetyltransferase
MCAEGAYLGTGARIRRFRGEDGAAVGEIAKESREAAQWPERAYQECLSSLEVFALVSEREGQILGFLIGRQIGDESEILNLAVQRGERGKGEGGALLFAAFKELATRQVTRLFLEVRESNVTGVRFYEKHGFTKLGRRPGYYRDPEDAAVLMEKKLTG